MGQKTYESLPFRPLKNRTNVVICGDYDVQFDGCVMAYSIEESIEGKGEVFIIGGGSIYKQFLSLLAERKI